MVRLDTPFSVRVSTDIYGRKYSRELIFPASPLIGELTNAVESIFDVIGRGARPAGYPDVPFSAHTFQVYDDLVCRWVDLFSTEQLSSGGQLHCFQPDSLWHSDMQANIPEPTRIVTWMTPAEDPRRQRAPGDRGVPPSQCEKLRAVFRRLGGDSKGWFASHEFSAALCEAGMQIVSTTAEDLFRQADADGDGRVVYSEWVSFGISAMHQDLCSALYFRQRDGAAASVPVRRLPSQVSAPTTPFTARSAEQHRAGAAAVSPREEAAVSPREEAASRAWLGERRRAQDMYERACELAADARSQARAATERERDMYEALYGDGVVWPESARLRRDKARAQARAAVQSAAGPEA
eukprot:TRINITY_DN47490_c0_g1_i1.p1 TRINITY_DN47490_c0_g1~~TRINITY_DN47490_c0_g1_i1.p1  ORF type:complete len:379 (+),score=106.02 TRINITY_DN47490_c0_g1_i1:85-1137(+)